MSNGKVLETDCYDRMESMDKKLAESVGDVHKRINTMLWGIVLIMATSLINIGLSLR